MTGESLYPRIYRPGVTVSQDTVTESHSIRESLSPMTPGPRRNLQVFAADPEQVIFVCNLGTSAAVLT